MGFGRDIAGKKGNSDSLIKAEIERKVEDLLQKLETLIPNDIKSAGKLIWNRPRKFEPLLLLGGHFYERFTNIVLKAKYQLELKFGTFRRELRCSDFPSVLVISNKEIDTLEQLIELTQNSKKELVYLWYEEEERDAVVEIDALYFFTLDPATILIYPVEESFFIKSSFLLEFGRFLKLDTKIEKISKELSIFLEKQKEVKYGVRYEDDDRTIFVCGIAHRFYREEK